MGQYIYQYRDHLGNTRISFAKNSEGALEVTDTNNYYPFGLNHISNSFSTSGFGSYYSYKYNGKELQETGMFDYGARMYLPDLGRWGVIDPLAEASRRFTPYHYGNNNPIRFTDPDGRLTVDNLQGGYTPGSAVMDFFNRNGLTDKRNMPLLFRNESGRMIETKALGNDGQGGGGSPTFQFPKGQEEYYKKNYPAFYNFVKNQLPNMVADGNFMNALSIASGFSIEELTESFEFGKGMYLKIMALPFGDAEYLHIGMTESSTLNTAGIQTALVEWFEKANRDSNTVEGISNLLYTASVIAHETTHWGDDLGKRKIPFEDVADFMLKNKGYRPGDVGNFFEYKAFGQGETGMGIGHYDKKISDNITNYVKLNFKSLQNIFK